MIEFVLWTDPKEGQPVIVQVADAPSWVSFRGVVTRCEDHEVRVAMLGTSLPFQKHDGEHWSCVEVTQDER